jgi:methanogenic corrinoid protein MtbC1
LKSLFFHNSKDKTVHWNLHQGNWNRNQSTANTWKRLGSGMDHVGKKFSENKIFVPQMLMSARAMGASMLQLKPFSLQEK